MGVVVGGVVRDGDGEREGGGGGSAGGGIQQEDDGNVDHDEDERDGAGLHKGKQATFTGLVFPHLKKVNFNSYGVTDRRVRHVGCEVCLGLFRASASESPF